MKELEFIKETFIKFGKYFSGSISGCSEEEIRLIESQFGFELPEVYIEFLKIMGKESAGIFSGAEISYSLLPQINSIARQTAAENKIPLLNNSFFFFNNLDYSFLYFIAGEENNPPVYLLMIADGPPTNEKVFDKLSDYFFYELDNYVKMKMYANGDLTAIAKRGDPPVIG